MGFFSKKTRRNNRISLFEALIYKAERFVVSGVFFHLFNTVAEHVPRLFKQHAVKIFVLLLVVAIGGLGIHQAQSQYSERDQKLGVKNTLLVYPSSISDASWSGVEHVLSPDLNEDALYQEFSAHNSAYVPLEEIIIDGAEQTEPEVEQTESNAEPAQTSGEDSVQIEPENTSTEVNAPATEAEDQDASTIEGTQSSDETDSQEGNEAEQTESDEESESESEPESEVDTSGSVEVSEPVVLKQATESFFAFLGTVTEFFPFMNTAEVDPEPSEADGEEVSQQAVVQTEEQQQETVVVPQAEVEDTTEVVPSALSVSDSATSSENLELPTTTQTATSTEGTGGSDVLEEETPSEESVPVLPQTVKSITLSDFSTPDLKRGEFITSMQLRMSLGASYEVQASSAAPVLEVTYKTASTSEVVGTILVDGEVSNALNGGYFLFALPQIADTQELNNASVEITFKGDTEHLDGLYLDAAWLQIDVEHLDKELLFERLARDILKRMDNPEIYTILSEDKDFTREELPLFSLKYNSQRNIAIRFIRDLLGRKLAEVEEVAFIHKDVGDIGVTPKIYVTDDGLFNIQIEEDDRDRLRPGEYTVEITVNEGGSSFTDSFTFQWGLLSINPDQTTYELGDTALISMGALSPNGNTLCDADLSFYVIDPEDVLFKVPVSKSGLCNGNNVVDVPDYSATFVPAVAGEYEMYLERIDTDGTIVAHTLDTFFVKESVPLTITRKGPSRIYPKSSYPMELSVSAKEAWEGTLIEEVPIDFEIIDTNASTSQKGSVYELSWDVSLLAGESKTFTYHFDAPDISPYLYTVGSARLEGKRVAIVAESATSSQETVEVTGEVPVEEPVPSPEESLVPAENSDAVSTSSAQIENEATEWIDVDTQTNELQVPEPMESVLASEESNVVFEEHRQWQIASDATGNMILYWARSTAIPAGWTCISCGSGTFYQRFAVGSSSYNTTGGSATHTHSASGTVAASTAANAENNAGSFVSIVSHAHTYTPTITSSSSLPAYRNFRVIQNNSAGEPASIPAGALLMFDASVPSGWTRYSLLDNRYPRGENSISNAGTSTHRHTISGSTDAASGSTYNSRTGGFQVTSAAVNHTHTVSSNTGYVNHEPPYITVLFATSSVATGTPTNALTMWSDTPPAQWLSRSNPGDPFYGKFLKGSATYGTTGGGETHTHANVTGITSSGAVGTDNARTGASGANSTHTHSIDVTNFTTSSHLPPYASAIIGKKYGPIPMYTQSAFRFYANTNANTPTDAWPSGGEAVEENEAILPETTAVKNGDVVRMRVQLNVSNSTSTSEIFKLQFASTTGICTDATSWTDVGSATSSSVWRGYNNAGVADGATLASTTLTGSDIFGSYEEQNPSVTMPNTVGIGQEGEWDFVVQQNGAEEGTTYCFRMVESDNTPLFAYDQYPSLITNEAPDAPTPSKLFDNEKVGTTTPDFEFAASDSEGNDITYQIQIDDTYDFSSTVVDRNSVTHSTQFDNLNTPADKDPFTNGELIHFNNVTGLSNNTTYYWRVRGSDPNGSNKWGSWSTIRSFTVDTSITLSTWFQTTDEQFNTNTLSGVVGVTDQAQLITGSTTGTMYSDPITFSEGQVGTAWGSFTFTDTETSSDLKYTIQYDDNGVWTDIPDSVLSGNTAGFDTSPVSLLGVDKTDYPLIRIEANFTNSGASPILQQWTVSWDYLIETPTISAPFANEKVSTTTPTFEFTTTDPQGDDLIYQVQWSTSYAFTSSTTRSSNINAGFTNADNGGDTSPFTSGDSIRFKIQSGDALTNGTTYWWRVRARDPLGANTYSFFTDPRSFTVDTSVTVSTWFQTTESQFDIDILSGAFTQTSGAVTVATSTSESIIVYAEGTVTTPRYREWNGSAWGTESSASNVGAAINWIVTKASPVENEYITGTLGTDADVNVQVYRNGSWGNLQEVTTSIPNTNMRGFDIAYEQLSGDAMVVTCDGDADPTYYTWNGSNWTNGGAIGLTAGNTCGWVRLISDPISDEIIAITRDTSGISYEARVWNGSSWGNSATWGSMSETNNEGIAAAYEESGNQAVVAVSNGGNANFSWRAWNGSTWSAAATVTLGDDFEWGSIVADDGSDNLAICYVDEDTDVGVVRWTGAAWTGQTELDTAGNSKTARPVDCAFEVGGSRDGYIMVVYSDTTNVRYRSWNGAAWAAEASVTTIGDSSTIQLRRTGANLIQLAAYDDAADRYDYSGWNGSSWSALQSLETDASVGAAPFKEPFMMEPRNPSVTASVVGDPLLDFYEGSGPYWQQMSWTDTTSGGSNILYQVEYYDGDSWELIPNTYIPGNSSGTTTSPINLSNVLPVATYDEIRPVANLSCNAGTCPLLSDWTITWAAGITISGTAQQYDQSTNVTSGTVAVAVNGVLQTGKTGSISGGVWSIANVNTAPGDIVTIFIQGTADSSEAVAVTAYDGVGNMSGIPLYQRHLTIGSDDLSTIRNTSLGLYDFTNTEDIFFNIDASNDLTLCATTGCGDAELFIKTGNTYQPGSGGDIITHDFENNGTLLLNGNTMRISGSWDNNATTTPATSTVIFTATSTSESINETGATNPSFYNLTLGEGSGSATWTLNTPLDVNNALNVSRGTLARGSNAITVAGNLSTQASGVWTGTGTTTFDGTAAALWSDASIGSQNIGNVVIDGTTKSVTLGGNVEAQSLYIGANDTLDSSTSNYDIIVNGNWINNNTFNARSGDVTFTSTSGGRVITAGGDNFYNLLFNGIGGAWSFTESTLGINNDLSIATGTVTFPTGTTTISGSFNNSGGTFAHNNALLYFNSSATETLTLSGGAFTNAFYNVRFQGSGSWSFTEANATTSNQFRVAQGSVTLPSGTLTVGDSFLNTGGTFTHNSGTVRFTSSGSETIDTNASFNSLRFQGSGSWSFVDASVTALGSLTINGGAVTLPSNTLTLGGSLSNSATLTHNSGTVLFNSTDAGETISLGGSSLYNATFNSSGGGWTISSNATTTNNFTLTSASAFTLSSGQRLSVGGTFTNSVGGAATTWTGSTLSLEAGNYSLNTKTNTGDSYATLVVKANTDIKMWNSSAAVYTVDATGSLYSQDHNGVDGDLYIYGNYPRSSGAEYWSYATDFDGTSLGTTSRQVDVRFQSGASASFTNSTLNIVGISSATTTIANQGSGTYTLSVSGGTTTAQYYSFANLGATGISLINANEVTALGNGAFTPDVNAGTALTVSSTTIDANPGLQIFNVNFSTSTAIAASNVTQTGGAPTSYWWFRNSSGNLDGEARDSDTGDPGSIRWDDSSLVLTISGTVYADDGVTPLTGGTCNGVATPVRVVVDGSATYDGSCSAADGSFSIGGVVAVGDPVLTIFLNGASGGEKAVVVTKTPTQDITNLDLYVDRVITRHEDTASLTIADMAVYDSGNDADVVFTAATSSGTTLSVFADTELFVWATTTFTPGGTVILNGGGTGNPYDGSLHIDNGATFEGNGTTTYTIGGTFTLDANASFEAASSTVLMTATTSGKALAIASGETATFNLLRFTGVGGGWNINGDITALDDIEIATGTVTGTGDISLPYGSFYGNGLLSLGAGTTTIERTNTYGGTQGWTFHNLALGNGSVVGTTTPASTATTTIGGVLRIATAHYLDAGASVFDLSGSGTVFIENGTFLEDTSTVRYSGSGATNLRSTVYYNLDLNAGAGTPTYTATGLGIAVLNNLSVGGSAPTTVNFDTNDTVLDVNGNLTIRSNGTLVGSNSGAFTIGGSYDNNGTFTSSGGTVTFDGAGTPSIAAGASPFGTVTINGGGSFTVTEHATTSGAFNLTSASAFTLSSGQTLAVGGVFTNGIGGAATTWTGSTLRLYSGTNYQINTKTISDTYNVLSVAANTDIRMWNSSASTYTVDATGSLYSQDHNDVSGDVYIYGNYPGNGGTDYWSYGTDFDGTALGGSSRQVDVRFQSGASMSLVTGGLQVLGTASASTSLQNQGSGTYGIRIGGTASTSWSYYDVEDMNTGGLTFSGTPNVVTLSRGDFEVSQNTGTAMTVGGSVITANAAKTFTNNIFNSIVGTAYNVTATGTSVSSWRFTNHTGNLDGEANDVDPDGDPGYVVWDDSAANITISGNVYSDEGSTVSGACDGTTSNVHIRVAGLTSYTTSCNASTGLYSVSGITYSPGDSLVVYIDGEAEKGATVTEDPVSNINNMHIYENRVIARHEGTDSLSIDDMAVWDSSDDADIPFTAVSGSPDTLSLPANRKLLVWSAKEFEPGGNVTLSGGGAGAAYDGTLEAQTNAIVTFSGTQQHSIGGSFILGSGATFDAGQSTTTFTTTGAARTIDINAEGFYNTAFTGSGSWTITDTTFDANNFVMTNGTLTFGSGTTTISGSWINTGGSFTINNSTVVFTATATGKTVRAGGSNFEEVIFNGTGGGWSMTDTNATTTGSFTVEAGTVSLPSGILSVGGNFRNEGGALTHNTSEIFITNATGASLLASSSDLYAVAFNGAGAFTMDDVSLSLLDDLRILQGSVTFATGTLSVGGSFTTTGGTFDHASGTVLFNSSDAGETINPGNNDFYNVVFNGIGGGWTVQSATTTNNFTLTNATSYTQNSGTRLYVGNVFTNAVGGSNTNWNGSTLVLDSGSSYSINTKTAGGDRYNTLIVGANTDIRAWNSNATTTTVNASGSLYSQDHGASNGALSIYGDFHISTTTEYWSRATDFDGTSLAGSERTVTVSLASNATTTVDGGTLHIVGASGNSTTITNQGSGTFAFRVTSGTFNGLYYAFRNLNTNGLAFSGTPTITSLSQGDFELAVNGGSLISLTAAALNANASKVITGARFATTSAITGYNVNLTGSTSNAWTFVSHTGNLDGEAYDNDGATACGSIRWSDSSCLLTQQTHYRWRNDDGGIDVPNSEWFNASWDARKRVRLENTDATTYTDAVVKLTVAYDADMQGDFDDLRFTDASGTTSIPYFIERYTASADADVWVQVPSLAASDITTIFMYFDNAGASSNSSSTTTFIAADDFEDGNISEYSGDTSLFTVDGSFAYGGSYGLDTTSHENDRATDGIARFSQTVSQGEIIRYMQYVDTSGGNADEACTLFGVQSPVTANQNYAVCLEQVTGTDRISISRDVDDVDTSGTILSSTTVAYATGWYEVEVDWQTNDDIDVTLSKDGSVVATTSATNGVYTSGGMGFTFWFQHGGWDNYTSRPRVDTEPTVYFGAKQTDGGASWKADIDEAASYTSGDVARLRLAIENSGLQITGQTFDIEFAEKNNAPSCEAVDTADYVIVPPQSSCGSSALCMQTSSNIADNGATTDLLFGPEGEFTGGKVVEDPSNTTAALTIDQDAYTELEYAITPTVNANEPAYCLRVTDAGDELDTYLSVAELNLRFDPVITNVSLNSGLNISLLPGATTTIYATGTVTDLNGYTDLVNATSTMYRSGVGPACSADNNSCYISTDPLCTFTNCSGNSCTVSCTADFYFHADATDVGSTYEGEEWLAAIEVVDQAGGIDIGSTPTTTEVEVVTLHALDVTSAISYGSLAPASTTESFNPTTTIQNLGNVPIDIELEGTDLTDGGASVIPTSEQKFATTTFTYTGCTTCSNLSSTTPIDLEVDLSKPTSAGSPVTDVVYWGIRIPIGIASNPHTGTNIFYAVDDTP